jgi:hypothetical protein
MAINDNGKILMEGFRVGGTVKSNKVYIDAGASVFHLGPRCTV